MILTSLQDQRSTINLRDIKLLPLRLVSLPRIRVSTFQTASISSRRGVMLAMIYRFLRDSVPFEHVGASGYGRHIIRTMVSFIASDNFITGTPVALQIVCVIDMRTSLFPLSAKGRGAFPYHYHK